MAQELFTCWDTSRLGHIKLEVLAENLISFGLAMSKEQVTKILS
jgi:Ca2+-binding EF-hand superfamily protein